MATTSFSLRDACPKCGEIQWYHWRGKCPRIPERHVIGGRMDDMQNTDCLTCGHSHSYDGPLKPLKTVDTPCWKCGCRDFKPATTT
jgi:hypothetical protein